MIQLVMIANGRKAIKVNIHQDKDLGYKELVVAMPKEDYTIDIIIRDIDDMPMDNLKQEIQKVINETFERKTNTIKNTKNIKAKTKN